MTKIGGNNIFGGRKYKKKEKDVLTNKDPSVESNADNWSGHCRRVKRNAASEVIVVKGPLYLITSPYSLGDCTH